MTLASQVKKYIKDNSQAAAEQLLPGAPVTKGDRTYFTVPYRRDMNPSLEIRKDGECFDNGKHVGDMIAVYAKWKGLDAKSDFPQIIEEMGQRLGLTQRVTMINANELQAILDEARRNPQQVYDPYNDPSVKLGKIKTPAPAKTETSTATSRITPTPAPTSHSKPTPEQLDAWAQENYGIRWVDLEHSGCTLVHHFFAGKGRHWAISYPLSGPKGEGSKIRSFERLDTKKDGRTKRLAVHGPGGAGFFPAASIEGAGPLYITAGEEKAVGLCLTGLRTVSYSNGETPIKPEFCEWLKQYESEIFVVYDGDDAGREASAATVEKLQAHGIVAGEIILPDGQDINDVLKSQGKDALKALVTEQSKVKYFLDEICSTDLMKQTYPAPVWIVDQFLPEGVTVLAAPPKIGKSFFCSDLACCIATGKPFLGLVTNRMRTLYIDAEQARKLIQKRLKALGWDAGAKNFTIVSMPGIRFDKKALDKLTPQVKGRYDLIVLDTMHRLLPQPKTKGDAYQNASEQLGPLHEWATVLGISALVIHHTKKGETSENSESHEAMSGGGGIAAVADTLITFKRTDKKTFKVSVTGRIEEGAEWALERDSATWKCLGRYDDVAMDESRRAIVDVLEEMERGTSTEIAKTLKQPQPTIWRKLREMTDDGILFCQNKKYFLASNCGSSVVDHDVPYC